MRSDSLLADLEAVLGPEGLLTGEAVSGRARGIWDPRPCEAGAILRPRSTEEVSRVLALCHAAGRPVVPMGGLTGLVQGGVAGPGELGLSLERMDAIERIDPVERTATVEAGVPLQRLQEAAEAEGLMFPLDLGARGSATVGGNVATNAGGNRVIRYGMTRDMVLGAEAVLADGTVIPAMNRMLKNNAGFDLKQLFIGSEGTLGIVTRLVLRLRELPASQQTALVACERFDQVTAFLKHVDRGLGGTLSAFEVMWQDFYRLVTTPPATGTGPLSGDHPYYVLVESLGGDEAGDQARFEATLGEALESGLAVDAAIATSGAQRDAMWALRDDVEQAFRLAPLFIFDVSLPLGAMESYVEAVRTGIAERWPEATMLVFGHLGDGNLHFLVSVGAGDEPTRRAVEAAVYEPLAECGGSVSAEHGIGLEKRDYLRLSRSEAEIELMRRLKQALDPRGILNPGKVIAPGDRAG